MDTGKVVQTRKHLPRLIPLRVEVLDEHTPQELVVGTIYQGAENQPMAEAVTVLQHNVAALTEKLVETVDIINGLHGYIERTEGTVTALQKRIWDAFGEHPELSQASLSANSDSE